MKEKLNIDNWALNFLLFRDWFSKNIVIFLIFPFSIISFIFINYGEVIEKVLLKNQFIKLFQLKALLKVFSVIEVPSHVKSLGSDSVIFIILLYFTWLITHSFYTYLQLFYNTGSKALLFFETIILIIIFIFIVSPNLPLAIIVSGYSVLAAQIILIGLYWVYSIKQKQ